MMENYTSITKQSLRKKIRALVASCVFKKRRGVFVPEDKRVC